jgi:alginate O-acetyltransferase complex protein AlgI
VGLGVQFFIVGLCQKALIANTVAAAGDHAFALPLSELTTVTAWIGAGAYMLQIYFDFCGYSNMAIGLAFLLGFRFPRNFNYPYASRSITEFWRRWHMSLSFWFRDYVYIPLGGSRGGLAKTLRNLLIVFFLTGLWHGAAWTFIVWGLFHGLFLILERLGLGTILSRSPQIVSRSYTLLVVLVGWVFFRATDFRQASAFLKAMSGFGTSASTAPVWLWLTPEIISAMVAGVIFSFPVIPWLLDRIGQPRVLGPSAVKTNDLDPIFVHALPAIVLLPGLILSVALLAGNSLNPFLYFRF